MPPASGFHQVSRLGEDEKRHLQVLRPRRPLSSIQRKFKSFLLSLGNLQWLRKGGCLILFWTPRPIRSKRIRLSISEHGKVCNKVYRHRYCCIQYANGLKDIDEGSFTWDYPEFSLKVDSHSTEEFPHKNHANDCGLQGYLALPIFEQWGHQQRGSTGALEILTCTENISLDATFLEKLKAVGLAIRCPPPCRKPEECKGRFDMRVVGLYPLRDLYNLPLIQLWFPCICTLVQQLRKYNVELGSTDDQEFSVEYSHKVDVFNANYRKVHRSACQTDGSGNGKEDPKTATVQEDDVQHFKIINSQLGEASNAAKRLKDDQVQSLELRNVREDQEVATVQEDNVQHCRVKNIQFSEATKRLKSDQVQSHEASGSHGEKQWLSLSVQQPNLETGTQYFPLSVQQLCSETTDDKKNPQGKTECSGEPGSNIRKSKIRKIITQAMIEESFGRRLKDAAAELKVSSSTLKRFCRKYGIKNWPSVRMPSDEPCKCGGKEQECDSRPSPEHKSREKRVTDVNGPGNYNFDHSHFLTVKARYDELGECGGKEQECDSRPSTDHNSREKQATDVNGPGKYNLDHNHSLIVKARYNECLVKFPFSTHSGIGALLRSLGMRFKLEVGRIRIEYEDEDGDKIMISCDEDLSYHMHKLSSSGSTLMDLSVLLVV